MGTERSLPTDDRGKRLGQELTALLAFFPSTASAQESQVGFFDATVEVQGVGANSCHGFSIGGSVPERSEAP